MSYRHRPKTGRPNICRATVGVCPFGETEDHYETKMDALLGAERTVSEELGSIKTLTKDSNKTLEERLGVVSRERLDKLVRQRLRNENTPREVDAMLAKTGDNTPFYVFYNANQEATLDYDNSETIKTFSKGACSFLASELNRVTRYPIALFKVPEPSYVGFGHAAIKLPSGEYFDITGSLASLTTERISLGLMIGKKAKSLMRN